MSNDVRLHAMSHPVEADAALQADSTSTLRRNPVTWLMNYLERANKESDKPFDCSLILGPSYTSTYSFGFGAGLSGSYSWDRADATLPKSNVLYFELENKAWICVRPSGTEPKIKLYVNAVSGDSETTQKLLNAYSDAAVKLLESL